MPFTLQHKNPPDRVQEIRALPADSSALRMSTCSDEGESAIKKHSRKQLADGTAHGYGPQVLGLSGRTHLGKDDHEGHVPVPRDFVGHQGPSHELKEMVRPSREVSDSLQEFSRIPFNPDRLASFHLTKSSAKFFKVETLRRPRENTLIRTNSIPTVHKLEVIVHRCVGVPLLRLRKAMFPPCLLLLAPSKLGPISLTSPCEPLGLPLLPGNFPKPSDLAPSFFGPQKPSSLNSSLDVRRVPVAQPWHTSGTLHRQIHQDLLIK